MTKYVRCICFVLTLVMLTGCVTPKKSFVRTSLPERLVGEGLLVFELHHSSFLSYGDLYLEVEGLDLNIKMTKEMTGLVVLPLPVGEYRLKQGRNRAVSGGGFNYTEYTMLTIDFDRSFKVQEGKVTNLGVVVSFPYRGYWFDNTKEVQAYMQQFYPTLASTLTGKDYILPEGKYLGKSDYLMIQEKIGRIPLNFRNTGAPKYLGRRFAIGPGGTFAKMKVENSLKDGVTPLPTNTLAQIISGSWYEYDAAALSLIGELYLYQEGTLRRVNYPDSFRPVAVHLFGHGKLVLMDGKGRAEITEDGGKTWRTSQPFAAAKLDANELRLDGINAKGGFYIYTRQDSEGAPAVLFSPYEKATLTLVDIPKDLDLIENLTESPAGLFLRVPNKYGLVNKAEFYYKQYSKGPWIKGELPDIYCSIDYEKTTSTEIYASSLSSIYKSKDGGQTWTVFGEK